MKYDFDTEGMDHVDGKMKSPQDRILERVEQAAHDIVYSGVLRKDLNWLIQLAHKAVKMAEIEMQQWEIVNPEGHKHMVAWQVARDFLKEMAGSDE